MDGEDEGEEEFESGVEAGGDLYSMVKDKLEHLLGDMDAVMEKDTEHSGQACGEAHEDPDHPDQSCWDAHDSRGCDHEAYIAGQC